MFFFLHKVGFKTNKNQPFSSFSVSKLCTFFLLKKAESLCLQKNFACFIAEAQEMNFTEKLVISNY